MHISHENFGESPRNSTIDRHTPVQVSGLSGVIAIAGGEEHSIGLESVSTVWTWGWNAFGQLGNNSTIDSHIPVQVKGPGGAGFLKPAVQNMPDDNSQTGSNNDAHSSGFGCGSIDLHGSDPKGPSDMGGLGSFMAILALPFIFRWWRKVEESAKCKLQSEKYS